MASRIHPACFDLGLVGTRAVASGFMRRPLRSAFVLGVLAGLVLALARALTRESGRGPAPLVAPPAPLPAVTPPARPPVPVEVVAGPEPPEVVAPTSEPAPAAPAQASPVPEPASATPEPASPAPGPARPSPGPVDGADGEAAAPITGTVGDDAAWVAPVDGACPDGFPIKAKVSSGIFHRPGGLSYERTRPDRCYPNEAAAVAEGFRAAKR